MEINSPTPEQITQLRSLWKEAFNDPDTFIDIFFSSAFSPLRARCVTSQGNIAAALYWFDCEWNNKKIAYIYAVATAKSHRGQGLCHRLMEDTHRHLKAHGYAGAVLVPGGTELFEFYSKMGYKTCSYVSEFTCEAANDAASLQALSKEEYRDIRRKFLPENAVVQENENLDFLFSYSDLFAGEDFVLAAHKEGETLVCSEFLGNIAKAPLAANALGCTTAGIRTTGGTRPFAMYCPLGADTSAPAYFGLAFD